jgi:hypothetical protein
LSDSSLESFLKTLTEKMLAALTSVALFILHVALILACAVSLQPVDRAAQVRPTPRRRQRLGSDQLTRSLAHSLPRAPLAVAAALGILGGRQIVARRPRSATCPTVPPSTFAAGRAAVPARRWWHDRELLHLWRFHPSQQSIGIAHIG